MKKKSVTIIAGIAIAALAVSTYASPHWQLYRMRAAVEARDAQALARYVDFPALRGSLKQQVLHRLGAGNAQGESGSNPFAAFGKAMASAVIEPVVDAAVSPEGVRAMLAAGDIRLKPKHDQDQQPPGLPHDERPREKPNYDLSYRSWGQVVIQKAQGGGVTFILNRDGLWSWKLAAIELPRG
jgi:hypothetical protein